tara:strand:+ start:832 stop:1365 length:534 start_codon:yes stop_codon:yes gene_type:complete
MKRINGKILAIMLFLASLSGGLFLGTSFKLIFELTTFKPYGWNNDHPPVVANCYGKDFSSMQMARAISYWKTLGYNVSSYVHDPSPDICKQEWVKGYITLRKSRSSSMEANTLARTKRYTIGYTVLGAEIFYSPGAQNLDLINEHELGHAFGFGHIELDNHIMHPLYNNMGSRFWIP